MQEGFGRIRQPRQANFSVCFTASRIAKLFSETEIQNKQDYNFPVLITFTARMEQQHGSKNLLNSKVSAFPSSIFLTLPAELNLISKPKYP